MVRQQSKLCSLNQAIFAGENLLNNLVEVLTRFRQGKFGCVADLSVNVFSKIKSLLVSETCFR